MTKSKRLIVIALLLLTGVALYAVKTGFFAGDTTEPVQTDLQPFDPGAMQNTSPFNPNSSTSNKAAPVEELLAGLRARLESQPEDMNGWLLLAKSYQYLNQPEEAMAAFARAKELGYSEDLPEFGGASQKTAHKTVPAYSQPLFEQIAKTANQDRQNQPPQPGIRVKVDISPELAQQYAPETAVFIFARSAASPGPPLAVVKRQFRELPLELVLDDSQAMMPDRVISTSNLVTVGARISSSGNPVRQQGDPEKISEPLNPGEVDVVSLVISPAGT